MNWVVFRVWIRVGGLVVIVDVLYHDFICVGVWTWRCSECGDVFWKRWRLSVIMVSFIQSLGEDVVLGRRC